MYIELLVGASDQKEEKAIRGILSIFEKRAVSSEIAGVAIRLRRTFKRLLERILFSYPLSSKLEGVGRLKGGISEQLSDIKGLIKKPCFVYYLDCSLGKAS